MFVVTAPAGDPNLLSAIEMRAAVGLAPADASKDADLAILNARVSRAIAAHCRVASAGVSVPTFRSETLTETQRLSSNKSDIVLARRPVVAVISIVEDGETLVEGDYELNASAGLLMRLNEDASYLWPSAKVVIVYTAGWTEVPADLKLAASKFASEVWSVGARDPNLRRIDVPGVVEREYWVSPKDDPLISGEVEALLAPYMNYRVG